jgi:hypothetical protein
MHHLHRHVLLKLLEKKIEISSTGLSSMADEAFVPLNHAGNILFLYLLCWWGINFRSY